MTSHTMHTSVTLDVLMQDSGVTFGTSGARGRVMDMTDRVCYAYVTAFTVYARGLGEAPPGGRVALAGDLRPSTPRILAACSQALVDQGLMPVNLGTIPTPALALYALEHRLPGLMVTGSHIPDDRNGIKFYRPQGEILKADEIALRGVTIWLDPARFDAAGQWWSPPRVPDPIPDGHGAFVARYLDSFSPHCLRGLRVAVYEHSSVARESLAEVLAGLGAEVVCLGRSGQFVPVDTEAIRPEDQVLARAWAK
ncbi:MAG: phosphomannomutase, partial [Pseudomonadota bacterium]